eukprot:m51a1_g14592 hypothetical protein (687) ;mRNA; f:1153870-1156347
MSDDEREMQEMRASTRFVAHPRARPAPAAPLPPRGGSDSDGDGDGEGASAPRARRSAGISSEISSAIPPDDADDLSAAESRRQLREAMGRHHADDEEDAPAVVDAEELRRAGLPTEFGDARGDSEGARRRELDEALRALKKHAKDDGDDGSGPQLSKREMIDASVAEFKRISQSTAAPAEAPTAAAAAAAAEGGGMSDEESGEDEYDAELPVSHEVSLKAHEKPVSALAVDPSGARVVTGSHDYTIKLWDFGGMDMRFRSFRSVEPMGGHFVNAASFSPSGDCFVCATASQQPKIYDRDARELLVFAKGDQYLSDMNHTKGHVGIVTNAAWSPADKNLIMTASIDGTLRLWDPMNVTQQKAVVKAKIRTPRQRAAITASAFDTAGTKIAAAISVEGTIQVWPTKGPFHRPSIQIENAHFAGSETSCLRFFSDNYRLLSRGMDDSMKLWDLRKPKSPVQVWADLNNVFPHTECAISPDERFVVTGTSGQKRDPTGYLRFFKSDTFELVKEIEYPEASVIRVAWHPKIDQLVLGLSDASARVLFDPKLSKRGALLCLARSMPKDDPYKIEFQADALNPHALPMFKRGPSKKKQFAKMRKDRAATQMPDIVRTQSGHGGRLGSCHTAHLLKTLGYANNPHDEADPREALLKYDSRAKEKSFFFKAYEKTQPEAQFSTEEPEEPPTKRQK